MRKRPLTSFKKDPWQFYMGIDDRIAYIAAGNVLWLSARLHVGVEAHRYVDIKQLRSRIRRA